MEQFTLTAPTEADARRNGRPHPTPDANLGAKLTRIADETYERLRLKGLRPGPDYDPAGIELTGAWLWLEFAHRPSADLRDWLKKNGWRWAKRKEQRHYGGRGRWYFAGVPGNNRRGGASMAYIRDKYGSASIHGLSPTEDDER